MRHFLLPLLLAVCTPVYCQFIDDFTDGDYTNNPRWEGTYSHFAINPYKQLQTKANDAATSYLSTVCRVNANAEWAFWARIACTPSAYNYMRIYITSTTQDPAEGSGLYVQIGGANKNITLYQQYEDDRQLLIENKQRVQSLAGTDNKVRVRISLDEKGVLSLYSCVVGVDEDYVLEGSCYVGKSVKSEYFSVLVCNSKLMGNCYYLDDIAVTGEVIDTEDVTSMGNLVINEIMYDPAEGGQEFIEVYNRDSVAAILDGVQLTTRNADGDFLSANKFPSFARLEAHDYAVLCSDAEDFISFYETERDDNIWTCSWSRKLSNSGATLYLLLVDRVTKDTTILDSVGYSPKWHHVLLEETKGVSLERIHPCLPSNDASSWHSASKDCGYATPGAQNSQYRAIDGGEEAVARRYAWVEEESFSPNGDGWRDVCLIHYLLPSDGYAVNMRVFTPRGTLIAYPYRNAIVSTEGVLVWNGRLTNDRVGEVGIYIIVCEFLNLSTGKSLKERFPVVISDR